MGATVEVVKAPPQPEVEVQKTVKNQEPPKYKKDLCVGTVFIDDSPLQRKWLNLQLRFLNATTSRTFDHVIFCAAPLKTDTFQKKSLVLTNSSLKGARQSSAHVGGLTCLLEHFKEHQELYDNFLFIDSDAFPIRKGWYSLLTKHLKRHEIAICIRPENLEQRLHSSVVFAKRDALKHLKFQVARQPLHDLCGHPENDVQCHPYQGERRDKAFPLLRSNKVELHPLLCGVYYDMFYHNGCGSGRLFNMRARGYWGHVSKHNPDIEDLIDKLMDNPSNFISELAGWSPDLYPKGI